MKNQLKHLVLMKLICLPILIILFIGGCHKDRKIVMVPDNFKHYFYFPVGSWWVYTNQYGANDTLTIKNITSDYPATRHSEYDKYERIIITYNSSSYGEIGVRTSYNSFFMMCENSTSYFTYLTNFKTDVYGKKEAQSCGYDIEWWIQDTVVIKNTNYYDVFVNKITSPVPPSIPDFPVIGYFKENIGLIKRELINGEVWELVDYKINK